MGVTGLNRTNYSGRTARFDLFGAKHVYGSACFLPGDRPSSNAYIPTLRATLPRRAVCKTISLSRLISGWYSYN